MSRTLARRRAWMAASVGLAAVFSVVTISEMAPSAKAESGRRLCVYVEKAGEEARIKTGDPIRPEVVAYADVYVAVDYKKDGDCPTLNDPYYVNGRTAKKLSFAQPVPKEKCENWYGRIGATGRYLGTSVNPGGGETPALGLPQDNPQATDVCTQMPDDKVYEFFVLSQDVTPGTGTGPTYHKGDFLTRQG